jgi:hypothetical protein
MLPARPNICGERGGVENFIHQNTLSENIPLSQNICVQQIHATIVAGYMKGRKKSEKVKTIENALVLIYSGLLLSSML